MTFSVSLFASYVACLDMNVAKMTAEDLPLFLGIMGDLFPGTEAPPTDYGNLKKAVIADLEAHGYQATDFIVRKTLELCVPPFFFAKSFSPVFSFCFIVSLKVLLLVS